MGRGVYRLRHGTRGVPLLTLLCSLSNVVNMQPCPPPPICVYVDPRTTINSRNHRKLSG